MMEKRKLLILGAGGAALDVLWTIKEINAADGSFQWEVVAMAEDTPADVPRKHGGLPILSPVDHALAQFTPDDYFHCCVGHNHVRRLWAEKAVARGLLPATLVHPSVRLADEVQVGAGAFIAAGSILCVRAQVGKHAIVNLSCTLGHESVTEDYAQLCPGVRLSGRSVVREEAFLGSNATVAPRVTVGRGATLGANSFAAADVPEGVTSLGVPARAIFAAKK